MSKEYKLRYEDKFHINNHGDSVTVRWKDNDCEYIKEGDVITELVRIRDGETDTQMYEVIGVSPFMKSFGIKGQIEVLQDSLSNFEWPDEYKEAIQDWVEELKPKQR